MKKYIVIFAASLLALVSCEKQFDVKDSNYLTGTDAISIAAEDPGFLASYVNGFYSWMVEFNGGGGSHQDFGHLSVVFTTDLMCQDIAICGSWNWGTYDINHDYGLYSYRRPYQLWNFYYTLIKKCNEVIDFFGESLNRRLQQLSDIRNSSCLWRLLCLLSNLHFRCRSRKRTFPSRVQHTRHSASRSRAYS